MVRFAIGPDAELVPDIAARLPGRGIWLAAERTTVDLAVRKRVFDRAARRTVAVPAGLSDRIEALLAARCRETIGLARRGGAAVAGFEKVCQALNSGKKGLLLEAVDGAADGRRKIMSRAEGTVVLAALTSAELGTAFGRALAVHVWIGAGPLAARLTDDAARLGGFRTSAVISRHAAADRRPRDGV